MQTAIKINTRVLAGCRVEFTSPELVEGEYLELIVLKDGNVEPALPSVSALDPVSTLHKDSPEEGATTLEKWGVRDWLQSLPPTSRTNEDWEAIERELKEDKDSWDR